MWRWLVISLIFATLAIVAFFSAFGIFSTPSDNMRPALEPGQRFDVSKAEFGISPLDLPFGWGRHFAGQDNWVLNPSVPERGDIILFYSPGTDRATVSRVIGLPGETISVRNGIVQINGVDLEQEFVRDVDYQTARRGIESARELIEHFPGGGSISILDIEDAGVVDTVAPVTVRDGHVYVMGDNRDRSIDSRIPLHASGIGQVPIRSIVGRVRD